MRLSRRRGQVTHVLLTRSPLITPNPKTRGSPFDLHVLSTPPAFVLSQDQTLQTKQKSEKQSPGPTRTHPNRQAQAKPKQNKAHQPNPNRPSQRTHYGIKNMTHYRVLKQHTHQNPSPSLLRGIALQAPGQHYLRSSSESNRNLVILLSSAPPLDLVIRSQTFSE